MLLIKIIVLFLIFGTISMIGVKIAEKYVIRAKNLKQIRKALNILETKIVYTNEVLPDIFHEIATKIKGNVGALFEEISKRMDLDFAGDAWESGITNSNLELKEEDKEALRTLGKLLGNTDVQGQICQIKMVNKFLEEQIAEANESKNKNEKMYKKLGIIVGLAVVIVLI